LVVFDAYTGVTGQKHQMFCGQRIVITDADTGKKLTYNAESRGDTGGFDAEFRVMTSEDVEAVLALDAAQTVLDGWWHDISVDAQAAFTINIGTDLDVDELVFWHHYYADGQDRWEVFTPEVYMYEPDGTLTFISGNLGNYNGFVVTVRGDTPNIPEPATMLLLAVGGVAMLGRRRWVMR
jgi:hypothetical protein